MVNDRVGTAVGAVLIVIAVFIGTLIGRSGEEEKVKEERPYYESNPAYIKEVNFEGNMIESMIINNEMLSKDNIVFEILPVAKDDETQRTYYVRTLLQATIYYKEGLDDFIKDYNKQQ